MQEPDHVRAISLILALSVVVGGWFTLEYINHPTAQTATRPTETLANPPLNTPPPDHSSTPPTGSSPVATPSKMSVTYKCEKGGRISFRDKPCATGERTLAAKPNEQLAPGTNDNLAQLKQQLAVMESYRQEREREYAARIASKPVAAANLGQSNEIRCKQIDQHIISIDSILRQPHSAQNGDYWTGKRKDLTDERFSLRC